MLLAGATADGACCSGRGDGGLCAGGEAVGGRPQLRAAAGGGRGGTRARACPARSTARAAHVATRLGPRHSTTEMLLVIRRTGEAMELLDVTLRRSSRLNAALPNQLHRAIS